MPTPHPGRARRGGAARWGLRLGALLLALLLPLGLALVGPAPTVTPRSVEIETYWGPITWTDPQDSGSDEDVLAVSESMDFVDTGSGTSLREELARVGFPRALDLRVVYLESVIWDGTGAQEPLGAEEAGRRYLAAMHPDLLQNGGRRLAPGLVLFVIDPYTFQAGVLAGPDVELSEGDAERVTQVMTKAVQSDGGSASVLASGAFWDAPLAGAEEYARHLPRQVWPHTLVRAAQVLGVLVAVAAAGVLVARLWVRARARSRLRGALADVEDIARETARDAHVLASLPVDSPHTATVRAAHAEHAAAVGALVAEAARRRVGTSWAWGLRGRDRAELPGLEARVAELGSPHLDVAAQADLLWLRPGWERAWAAETAPLRARLAEQGDLGRGREGFAPAPEGIAAGLAGITADLRARRCSADEGLRRLAALERRWAAESGSGDRPAAIAGAAPTLLDRPGPADRAPAPRNPAPV